MTHIQTPNNPIEEERNTPEGYKWRALCTVAMGAVMGTMDFSITNITLPILTRVFQEELSTVIWVTLVYTLVSTSLMLSLGRTGDLVGRKRIYSAGMAIFTVGLFACSTAQSIGQLILFRGILSVGGAMMVSCGAAIVTEAFPRGETGRGLGLFGVAVSLGFIMGPVLGGFLLDWLGWRSIFYVRIPLGLITFLMSCLLLKKDRARKGPMRLDLAGTGLSSLSLFCLVFSMSQMKQFGPLSPLVLGLLGLGIAGIVMFILVERRVQDPLVDLSLFKSRVFSGAGLSLFLSFMAAPFYILIMPFYLMQGINLSPSATGLLMAVLALTTIVVGPLSGWLSDRYGTVWFAMSGSWIIAAGFFLMRGFDLQTRVSSIIPVLVLLGLGVGTFQVPNNSTMMRSVSRDRLGTASALIATFRQVGMTFGMALAGVIFSARRLIHQEALIDKGTDLSHATRLSIPLSFHEVLWISISLSFFVGVLSLYTGLSEKLHRGEMKGT